VADEDNVFGTWVKAADAKALEKRCAELESALSECDDSQLGHWILKAQRYEKVLKEIADYDGELAEEQDWPVSLAQEALEVTNEI
jgi:HPt (histidine-containing phosphotransfer) domain-containing protein